MDLFSVNSSNDTLWYIGGQHLHESCKNTIDINTESHLSVCVCVINFVHASLSIAYWDLFPGNKLLCQPSHENCLHRSKIESKSLSDAVQNMQHACLYESEI